MLLDGWIRPLAPAMLLALAAGCAKGPTFSYNVPEGFSMARYHTIALDPREDVVVPAEGKRPVNPKAYAALVTAELQGKGYRLVPPGEADLWVDVSALAPVRFPAGEGGRGEGRGRRNLLGGGQEGASGPRSQPLAKGQPLAVVVELLERADTRSVWLGVVELPAEKGGVPGADAANHASWIKQLLGPLPGVSRP